MTQKHRIVVTDFIQDDLEPERKILGDVAELTALCARSEDDLNGQVDDADAIMLYHDITMSAKTIQRLRRCKLIVRCGVGFDNVDCEEARQYGIPVANVPDYGCEEVADSSLGMMLSLTRGIGYLNSLLRAGQQTWEPGHVAPLYRLRNWVLGIVGLGRIGTAVAMRAKSFGMDVVFFDPYKPDGFDKALGIRRAESLEKLLRAASMLSLHCPLTEETRYLINHSTLSLLPMGSYLVNTARGAIVDQTALVAAIESGRLAGAGIDVLEREPPAEDDPILRAWRDPNHPAFHRVLINPHSAFYSEESLLDIRIKGAIACRLALSGQQVRNVIN
ncbi:MAG: C-terminal binding protein [Pirellulales bacterium]|nr:C-terminal binding protein [Pirellulales bacterium]